MDLRDHIDAMHAEMKVWRHDLHTHPELGFEEQRTAAMVAEKLASFGCEVHRGIAGTGVIGVLRSGNAPGTIGLRSEIDALPIEEANNLPYRSVIPGRMHACGHDGHAAMLLGAAKYLAETKRFDGTVHFIFQPAEEGLGGAKAMLEEGLFERFPCDSIFSLHNSPGTPVGKFWLRPGTMMAGGAFFDIKVTGRMAHGAWPEDSIDAVLVASQITNVLQSIVARNVKPMATAVISVTSIVSGNAYNVIPESAHLRGTARFFDEATRELLEGSMRRVIDGVARALGAKATMEFRIPFAPLVNDAAESDFICDVTAGLFGEDKVDRSAPPLMGSEDFSYMLQQRPGAYLYLGNGEDSAPVHTPRYDFNDALLPQGAAILAATVEKKLARLSDR